jgi:type VI protein secretion system component Hcp
MKKKPNRKSGSVKSLKNLPAKTVKGKAAKGVRGGSPAKQSDNPTESITLNYGKIKWEY